MEHVTNALSRLSSVLTKYIGMIIICFSVIAFFWRDGFAWTTNYTSIFLGVAMFGMGLTIHIGDFKVVFTRPKEIIIGFVAQYTIMPLIAWGLSVLLHLPTDIALGVILVGCCPGGTASNVITYIAGGDVALSVGMTITSTLAAPVMTPLLVYLLAGAWVQVSFPGMVISVVKVVLIPVLLGILLRRLIGRHIEKLSGILPLISVVSIVMIISGIVAVNAEKIMTSGFLVLCIVILHNLAGMGLGLLAGRIFHVEYDKATALAIEVGMQNSGLAITLATANFAANPFATLPGAIFSVWHNISGSLFASLRRSGKYKIKEQIAKAEHVISLLIDAIAATHGVYNRQKTKRLAAATGVIAPVSSAVLPKSTESVDTTLSFAINPVISAVEIFQFPKPSGRNTGAMIPATTARILSLESATTFMCKLNVCRNQMIIVAKKITVNALCKKSFAFSHRSCPTFFAPGIR